MLIFAAVFIVAGLTLLVLSRYRGDSIGRWLLPEREARRVWIPGGLLLMTLGALFGVMFATTLPTSPLRQAETRVQQTNVRNSTLNVHTAYFMAHTVAANMETGTYGFHPPAQPTKIPGTVYSEFDRDGTQFIYFASSTASANSMPARATNRARTMSTLVRGDNIALTGTIERTLVTATPTLIMSYTPSVTPDRRYVTDFELTATAIIVNATLYPR